MHHVSLVPPWVKDLAVVDLGIGLPGDDQGAGEAALRSAERVVDQRVLAEEGRIVLEPLRRSRASDVRRKLAELGITESDVADAIETARKE